tara:strand:+ start:1404 stop:3065 length:1662 start_codon:yes stop_codon:yes gene_type:complete
MFKSTDNVNFVPTKVISIKPEAQVNYNPKTMNQLRWLIPQYIGFFDPRSLYMKYNIKMSGRGHAKPDWRAGVHSLWRDVRIQDGSGSAELEMLQDYNVQTANWWEWTTNESINNKRSLFEGRSETSDVDEQIYYGASGDWSAGAVTDTFERKQLEIQQPIYSGILGGERVFPVAATKGLRVQMTLDDLRRSLVFNDSLGVQESGGGENQYCESDTDKLINTDIKTAIDTTFTVTVRDPASSTDSLGVNLNAVPYNNNPFDIGDLLYTSNQATGTDEQALGVITGFNNDAGKLVISYIPNRALPDTGLASAHAAGDRLYVKAGDRINGVTLANVPAASAALAAQGISYELSNIEMLVLQVQPPEGYVNAMMSQVSSSTGLNLDFRSYTLYRFNLNTINGLTNQLIPANQRRAYSIFSVPLSIKSQNELIRSSLVGIPDNAQNYQYVFRGNLIPDRPIRTERFSQVVAHPNALALVETEKALVNANYGVRNLVGSADRFVVARAFSKYNQIFDLSAGDLALRVEYEGATQEKLYEHFVQYIRRINIGAGGTVVSF